MSKIQEQISLKRYNTFGIDANARYFVPFQNAEYLKKILNDNKGLPILILGGGSNVLFTKDFEGLVLKNEILGIKKLKEDEKHVWLEVGAGEEWHKFVLFCIENNYAGIENLSLIPGTVGAAPMQNIGAYGIEVKSVIETVKTLDKISLEIKNFDKETCEFAYRSSIFKTKEKDKQIILSVVFRLNKIPKFNISYGAIKNKLEEKGIKELSIKVISEVVCEIRNSKLPNPKEIGNGGSFFKNPEITKDKFHRLQSQYPDIPNYPLESGKVKIPAAWLIDRAGWKGKRFGDAGVHKNQALVLVNYGQAKGQEIANLAQKIQSSVLEKYDILLNPEVNMI